MKIEDLALIVEKRDVYTKRLALYKSIIPQKVYEVNFTGQVKVAIGPALGVSVKEIVQGAILRQLEDARAELMLLGITEFTPDTEIPSLPGSQA